MSWVLDLSILLSICRVYIYIYVRLIMSSYLLFCIYFNVWYIACCPKWKALEFTYRVIVEVLVLGLLVVYKRQILSTILLKSIVFMFTGGCKIQYICCVFNQNCSGLCHIYSWFLSMWWVLSLSVLLSICRVYIYIYVRLIMSSYLLFCLVYYMLSKWKEALHVG